MTDRNEVFKCLLKLGVPINTLIGAARSAEGMDKYYAVPKGWVDSLLAHAEAAKVAWEGIVGLVESTTAIEGAATPSPVIQQPDDSIKNNIVPLLMKFDGMTELKAGIIFDMLDTVLSRHYRQPVREPEDEKLLVLTQYSFSDQRVRELQSGKYVGRIHHIEEMHLPKPRVEIEGEQP